MTEMVGYNGPIYMTMPTKAICPILLVKFFFPLYIYKRVNKFSIDSVQLILLFISAMIIFLFIKC